MPNIIQTQRVVLGAPQYRAQGVSFDGTDDYLSRGANLTGISDSQVGTISFWFWMKGGDGAFNIIFNCNIIGPSTVFNVRRDSSDKMSVFARNNLAATILNMASTTSYTSSMTGWAHFVASWDLSAGVAQMYINGADDRAGSPTIVNDAIAFGSAGVIECTVGASGDGTSKLNADIADLWFTKNNYLDLSTASNVQKFRTPGGTPVNLGANGSGPTSSQPIAFFSGAVASWETNLGSGGGMTENGALTAAATNPP